MRIEKDGVSYVVSEIVNNDPIINFGVDTVGGEPNAEKRYYWFEADNLENLEEQACQCLLKRPEFKGAVLIR